MTILIGERAEQNLGRKWTDVNEMISELDDFRRHSERLELMNQLHQRLAGLLSVSDMVEAYSVWLAPVVRSELVGYASRLSGRKHFSCSSHGPIRKKALEFAEQLIASDSLADGALLQQDGLHAHKWLFESGEEMSILLILKQDRQLNEAETSLVSESLNILASSLNRALHYEELVERASKDPLTGLANRRVFDDRIVNIIERSRRYRQPVSMVVMDLDYFKDVNDTFGHLAGDEVLVAVAEVLKANIRSTDLLVRLGGDEFVAILENSNGRDGAKLAERICARVSELKIRIDDERQLGISIGVAELKSTENATEWQERADDILYLAKDRGRSQVAV